MDYFRICLNRVTKESGGGVRVLFIWHAAVVDTYRERFRALVRLYPALDLHVIVPPKSYEGGQWVSYVPSAMDEGYVIRPLPTIWTVHPNGLFYRRSFGYLRRMRPNLVHIHEEAWTLAALQCVLAFGGRVPIVLESFENLARRIKRPFNYVERFVMPRLTAAVGVTAGASRILGTKNPDVPLFTIPYGTVIEHDAFGENRMLGSCMRIGYIGRLVEEKGIRLLLEAASRLTFSYQLQIVGDGPLAPWVKTHVEHHQETMTYEPAIPPENVGNRLRGLDVIVLPSLTTAQWAEQFGRIIIEAMAVGTVPIGSDSGEIPWVIGSAGVVVQEGSATQLAQALTALANNPERWRDLSQKSYRRARDEFSWDASARATMTMYRYLVEHGNRR